MGIRKKLINHTNIPTHKIETIARCILPDILTYFESEEGQLEFAKWRENQKMKLEQQNRKKGQAYQY